MAVKFLDNLDLAGNELLNVRIQNLSTGPAGASTGDFIYNSTSNKIQYWNGTSWISIPDGIGIGGSGTVGTIPVFSSTTELADSQLQTSGSGATQTFTFNTGGEVAMKGNLRVDQGGIVDVNGSTGVNGYVLFSNGSQIEWGNAPVSYTKWIIARTGGQTADVNDGDKYQIGESSTLPGVLPLDPSKSSSTISQDFALHTKNMTVASPSTYSTDVLLWGTNTGATSWKVQQTHVDDIPVSAWGDATGNINMGNNRIINIADPTLAQMAATKNYVDNAIVGGFNVKGGFNANTGVISTGGNLTIGASRVAIAVGDYYVVTVAGNFFNNAATPLTPGDSVLVQTAAAAGASVEGDFAVIQSDTDLASLTQIGIGNVNKDTGVNGRGLAVSYTNGTATLGLDIKSGFPTLPQAVGGSDRIIIWDGTSGNQGNYFTDVDDLATGVQSVNSFAGNNSSSGTSHTFTHNLGTGDVMVQLYDTGTKETIYATVDRTGINTVVVTTASSIASGAIRALITKIG